jgi:hypothetical protein
MKLAVDINRLIRQRCIVPGNHLAGTLTWGNNVARCVHYRECGAPGSDSGSWSGWRLGLSSNSLQLAAMRHNAANAGLTTSRHTRSPVTCCAGAL